MICWYCDKPIVGRPKTYDIPAASGAGATVQVHAHPCQRPPTQTYQVPSTGVRRSRR